MLSTTYDLMDTDESKERENGGPAWILRADIKARMEEEDEAMLAEDHRVRVLFKGRHAGSFEVSFFPDERRVKVHRLDPSQEEEPPWLDHIHFDRRMNIILSLSYPAYRRILRMGPKLNGWAADIQVLWGWNASRAHAHVILMRHLASCETEGSLVEAVMSEIERTEFGHDLTGRVDEIIGFAVEVANTVFNRAHEISYE